MNKKFLTSLILLLSFRSSLLQSNPPYAFLLRSWKPEERGFAAAFGYGYIEKCIKVGILYDKNTTETDAKTFFKFLLSLDPSIKPNFDVNIEQDVYYPDKFVLFYHDISPDVSREHFQSLIDQANKHFENEERIKSGLDIGIDSSKIKRQKIIEEMLKDFETVLPVQLEKDKERRENELSKINVALSTQIKEQNKIKQDLEQDIEASKIRKTELSNAEELSIRVQKIINNSERLTNVVLESNKELKKAINRNKELTSEIYKLTVNCKDLLTIIESFKKM